MNTQKRLISGVFVGSIGFVLVFLQSILIVPILLSIWGNETYGLWLVLNAGYIILQTIDSGQQSFIGNEFNIKYYSENQELQVTLASSIRIAFLIGIFQCLIVVFLSLTNTTHLFLGLDAITVSREHLNFCLIILVLSWISSGSYSSILAKLLIPYGYYSESVWWGIYNKIGTFIILIIIALNHGTIIDATIGVAISTITVNFILLFRAKKLMPNNYPWWRFGDWKIGFFNLKKSMVISFVGLLQQFGTNGLILLITNLFGAIQVPSYSTIRTITNSATSATNVIIQPLQPEIVKFRIQNEIKKIIDLFDINWLISGFIINIGILSILPLLPDIYSTWTRGKIEFNLNLFLFLAWAASIFNFGSILVFYLHSLNRIKKQLSIAFYKLLIIFGISIFFSKSIGMIAVGLGIAIAELISYVVMPFLFLKAEFNLIGFELSYKVFLTRMIPSITLGFIFILISIYPLYLTSICLIGVITIGVIYFYNWKILPLDLKVKVMTIFKINK